MAEMAYPRSYRIRSRQEFQELNREGHRLSLGSLVIRYRANTLGHPRFGLTVSRRVGNAVCRNRVKRHLREAIRRQREAFGAFDVVIIARPKAAELSHEDFFGMMGRALDQALGQHLCVS